MMGPQAYILPKYFQKNRKKYVELTREESEVSTRCQLFKKKQTNKNKNSDILRNPERVIR